MTFSTGELGASQLGLLFNQRAGNLNILVEENAECQLQIFNYALVEGFEFIRPLFGEFIFVLDLLRGELHQILVDDVPNMLNVDGKRNDFCGALTVSIVETFTSYFCYVELYRFVQAIDYIVHTADFENQLPIIGHQRCHRFSQHILDNIAHVQRLPRRTGQRD